MSALSRRHLLKTLAAAGLVGGCGPQLGPYQAKAIAPPPIKNCFDTIGHQGFKPHVLGGTCYCNPLPAQIAIWQKDGHFQGKSGDEIVQVYQAAGFKTLLDHQDCNNLCEWGPHVVKGGKCMVPPTPLTDNYEEVAVGKWKTA
jgi:hypothetical protein